MLGEFLYSDYIYSISIPSISKRQSYRDDHRSCVLRARSMPVQASPNLERTPNLHAASREIGQLWMTFPGGGGIVGEYILRG